MRIQRLLPSLFIARSAVSFGVHAPPPRVLHRALFASAPGDMRAGEIKKELESYGISTRTFLEKTELVDALNKARADGLKPQETASSSSSSSSGTSTSSTASSSSTSSSSDSRPREERIAEEMEACKAMKAGDLKKELEGMGVSTKSFFEKTEFVKACAEARVDGVKAARSGASAGNGNVDEEGYAEYKNVEVLTSDDAGPRKRQSEQQGQPQQQRGGANPFGGGGNPFGGGGSMPGGMPGGMGGIADMLKNMGGMGGGGGNPFGGGGGGSPFGGMDMGKAQQMMSNPKVMELMTKAQSNPKVAAAMQECMSNPAAFAKYQNDPEIAELINELKNFM